MTWQNMPIAILTIVLGVGLSSCTRGNEETSSMTLRVPINSSSFSSLSITDKLMVVIVNVRVPGKNLFAQEIDFHNNSNPPTLGQNIQLEVPNVPSGNSALIQYLGVFETSTGSMLFTYGDTTIDISGAQVTASITATQFGSSTKQGQIAGRFFNEINAGVGNGPTGEMVGYIMPPGGKPRMAVTTNYIVDGWFNIFVLEGATALMTYELKNGIKVFENVNLALMSASTADKAIAVFSKPVTYRRNHETAGVSYIADGAQDFIGGFFRAPGLSVSGFPGNHKLCYPVEAQSIPRVYKNAIASAQTIYESGSGDSTRVRKVADTGLGIAANLTEMYLAGTDCDPAVNTRMRFMPHRLAEGEKSAFGIYPPFRILDPFRNNGGYVKMAPNASLTAINLDWAYIPGVTMSGATIYGKFSTSTSSSGNRDEGNCQMQAQAQGMLPVKEISASAVTTSITSAEATAALNQSINSSSYHNFRFLICPYRLRADNTRNYLAGAQEQCMGDCGSDEHFGWAQEGTGDVNVSTDTSYTGLGGYIYRMTNTAANTGHSPYHLLTLGSTSSLTMGDEVLLRVLGQQGSGCGTNIQTNQYGFSRVLWSSGTSIKVSTNNLLQNIATTGLATTVGNTGYCYVQVAKVLHFNNLTLSGSGTQIYANQFGSFSSSGILPLRISGKLEVTGDMNRFEVSGTGYLGGESSAAGAGTGPGAGAANGGGGGAGVAGAGGVGSSAAGGNPNGGGGSMLNLAMGSGGGAGGSSSGGVGGGTIFIMARKIDSSSAASTPVLHASGYPSVDVSSTYFGGGGGGGSITVYAEELLAPTEVFRVEAHGGDGAASGGAAGGGGGGGGFVRVVACVGGSKVDKSVAARGGFGGGTSALPGAIGTQDSAAVVPTANLTQYGLCHVSNN